MGFKEVIEESFTRGCDPLLVSGFAMTSANVLSRILPIRGSRNCVDLQTTFWAENRRREREKRRTRISHS